MDVREILIPGRSMALAGQGIEGRTLMLIELAAAALKRTSFDTPPRVVVMASKSLLLCFRAEFGSKAEDIEFVDPAALNVSSKDQDFDTETSFALLERLARLHRPNLVVLQSIESLVGARIPTRATFERTMRRLSELALRLHTAILTVEPNLNSEEVSCDGIDPSESNRDGVGVRNLDIVANQSSLKARLEHWLSRGEIEALEIVRRTIQEGYSLQNLEDAKRSLGIRSYVRLSEGVRRRVWRLRDS